MIQYKRAEFKPEEIKEDFVMEKIEPAIEDPIVVEAVIVKAEVPVTSQQLTIKTLINLVATLRIAANNAVAAHWNLRATESFLLFHKYFGKVYQQLLDHVDVVAEQLRQFEVNPPTTFQQITQSSKILESEEIETTTLPNVISKLISDAEIIKSIANEFADSDYMDISNYAANIVADVNKHIWFLKSSITTKPESIPA